MPERGTLSLPDAAWAEAQRRAVVIGPLAAQDAVSAATARDAGQALGLVELGITRQTLYRHVDLKGRLRLDGEKLLGRKGKSTQHTVPSLLLA